MSPGGAVPPPGSDERVCAKTRSEGEASAEQREARGHQRWLEEERAWFKDMREWGLKTQQGKSKITTREAQDELTVPSRSTPPSAFGHLHPSPDLLDMVQRPALEAALPTALPACPCASPATLAQADRRTEGLPGLCFLPAATQNQSTSAYFNQGLVHMAPIAGDGKGTPAVMSRKGCAMHPVVPRFSLLTQLPGQHQASHVRGFSFHFLSPSVLSRALDVLRSALQEEMWDFVAFCSLGIAPWGPAAPWPLTHCKHLCFSVLSNLSACSVMTHLLHHLQVSCMVKKREIATSAALAFSNPVLSCETAKGLLEGPSCPCLMGREA